MKIGILETREEKKKMEYKKNCRFYRLSKKLLYKMGPYFLEIQNFQLNIFDIRGEMSSQREEYKW